MRVEALGMQRSRLGGDVFGVLEGSRPRQLTVQLAPRFGLGASDRRVRAWIRFPCAHHLMARRIARTRRLADSDPTTGACGTGASDPFIVADISPPAVIE